MLGEVAPRFGEDRPHAVEEPLDLQLRAQEDSAQDEPGGALGMADAVRQRKRAAPRSAEQEPARDAELDAELLHVTHEVGGGVVVQVAERHRAATTTLIEHDYSIELRIKEAAMHGG